MAKNTYLWRQDGTAARYSNRFGGEKGFGHDRYSAVERRKTMNRVLDHEFALILNDALVAAPADIVVCEPESVWTVLEPESGKFHNRIIIVEGDYDLAVSVYAARTGGRHPEKVSCDCGCGADYRLSEVWGSLRFATASVRHCGILEDRLGNVRAVERRALVNPSSWHYQTLEQFLAREDVTVIRAGDILPEEAATAHPRRTYPSDYSRDVQALAWVLDVEM